MVKIKASEAKAQILTLSPRSRLTNPSIIYASKTLDPTLPRRHHLKIEPAL